jgi:hypothetical protein
VAGIFSTIFGRLMNYVKDIGGELLEPFFCFGTHAGSPDSVSSTTHLGFLIGAESLLILESEALRAIRGRKGYEIICGGLGRTVRDWKPLRI